MFRRIGFAGLLIPAALAAQATPCMSRRSGSVPAAYADVVTRERTLVCQRLATNIPGVHVAVAVNGKLVWSEGFGYAEAERQRPVGRETQFRIGSVSRPLTATAAYLDRTCSTISSGMVPAPYFGTSWTGCFTGFEPAETSGHPSSRAASLEQPGRRRNLALACVP